MWMPGDGFWIHLFGRPIDWSIDWSTDWLIDFQSVDWLIDWLIDHQNVHLLLCCFADSSMKYTDFADYDIEEEFYDAAEVLNGQQNIYDMKLAANVDLEKSGLRDDQHVTRTESMSPGNGGRVSVNRYFSHRSAYSSDLGGYADQLAFLGGSAALCSMDVDRAQKLKRGPSSVCSSNSSVRSSIGTVAALEELDRILQDSSSGDDSRDSPPPSPVKSINQCKSYGLETAPSSRKSINQRNARVSETALLQSKSINQSKPNMPQQASSHTAVPERRTDTTLWPSTVTSTQRAPYMPEKFAASQRIMVQESKTEEILRRANNVLERVVRMKHDALPSVNGETFRKYVPSPKNVEIAVPKRRESAREPLSAPQARSAVESPTTFPFTSRHFHYGFTESSAGRRGSMSCLDGTDWTHNSDWNLLEQSVYPVGRSSVEERDIAVATERIFFPPTMVGESSSAKLQVKNYTAIPHQVLDGKNHNCFVPLWCLVPFWTHPEIIPVGQFFRRWMKSINQSIKNEVDIVTRGCHTS